MGNNHSSPICNRLCPGSTKPLEQDPDEWFDMAKKKRKKPSRKTGYTKMPPLPEESPDEGAFNVENSSETTNVTYESSSGRRSISGSDAGLSTSREEFSQDMQPRRHSEGINLKKTTSSIPPKAKLTFVNGQFIDLDSVEGKEIAAAAKIAEAGDGPPQDGLRRNEIPGVDISIHAGHGRVLRTTSGNSEMVQKSDSPPVSKARKTILGSKRSDSNASQSSNTSCKNVSSTRSSSSRGDAESNSHSAVTSIISIGQAGDGYFLTASKYDRAIKMWRVTDKSLNVDGSNAMPEINFVRNFCGHNTGVTTLTRIDNKGRFLSGSKDGVVILWDSRYDCGDDEDEDSDEYRIILAKFDKIDRRAVTSIAMLEEGSYVRPDDELDFAMLKAAARKTFTAGSAGLQQAAHEKHVIGCSCEFATISGHPKVVKLWSVQHSEDQECVKAGGNCAEVKLEQEIKNDIVIQSIATVLGKGIILTGDRMGNIKLWRGGRGMLGSNKAWTCERAFDSKKKKLQSVDAAMDSSITALRFLSDVVFVSGSRGGSLQVWNICEDKKLVDINGAHSDEIVDIKLGCYENRKKSDEKVVFSSAAEDGKVLSWAMTLKKNEKPRPLCCDVVYHSISTRYFSNRDVHTVTGLECVEFPNTVSCDARKAMISCCSGGDINLLKVSLIPGDESQDALLAYREQLEEEAGESLCTPLYVHKIINEMSLN